MNQTQPHNNLSPEDVMRVVIEGVRAMFAGHNPDKKLKELRKQLGNAAKQIGVEPADIRRLFDETLNEKEEKMSSKKYFFAKKIESEPNGPHHWACRVSYHCACRQVHGIDSDADWRDGKSPIMEQLLAANGETDLEKLQEVFGLFGYKGHYCE